MYILKDTDYSHFISTIKNFANKEFVLNDSPESIRKNVEAWEADITIYISETIIPNSEIFKDILDRYDTSIMDSFRFELNHKDPVERTINQLTNHIANKVKNLKMLEDYVSISNTLVGMGKPMVKSAQEKIDFILEKLENLNNENFYSVEKILKLNDISFRSDEPLEISEILFKKGYASKKDKYGYNNDEIRISVKGGTFIERKLKSRSKKKSDNSLDKKIDDILIRLKAIGFGQEIIFEELEEMRELQMKLSKKSWGQLLKGKLIDLAISKVINKEVANDIFKFLTDHHMNLLK